jgi:hypothetical protein
MVIAASFMCLSADMPNGLSGIPTAHGGGNIMKGHGTMPVHHRMCM